MTLRSAQTRSASLIEALTNVLIGYGLALATQQLVFPPLGIATTLVEDSLIAGVFTAVSLVRSFLLRRLFERLATVTAGGWR